MFQTFNKSRYIWKELCPPLMQFELNALKSTERLFEGTGQQPWNFSSPVFGVKLWHTTHFIGQLCLFDIHYFYLWLLVATDFTDTWFGIYLMTWQNLHHICMRKETKWETRYSVSHCKYEERLDSRYTREDLIRAGGLSRINFLYNRDRQVPLLVTQTHCYRNYFPYRRNPAGEHFDRHIFIYCKLLLWHDDWIIDSNYDKPFLLSNHI